MQNTQQVLEQKCVGAGEAEADAETTRQNFRLMFMYRMCKLVKLDSLFCELESLDFVLLLDRLQPHRVELMQEQAVGERAEVLLQE